jgi:4-hydroxybenzoyl-CoA thioesterase/acyl-CoA thioester hydrolase
VHVSCDYHSPARFEDVLDIAVEVAELGERKVVYRFALACGARRVATGTIVAVCCVQTDEGAERRLRSVPIPADVRAALAAAGPAVGGDVPAAPPAAP